MKMWILMFAVFVAICASGVEIPVLPPSEFADTEVSTNFTFAVGEGSNRRLVFSLDCLGRNRQAKRCDNMV